METNGTTMEELRTMESIQSISRKMPDLELRDLYAIHAMNTLLEDKGLGTVFNNTVYPREDPEENPDTLFLCDRDWIAKASYLMADSMLRARKEK